MHLMLDVKVSWCTHFQAVLKFIGRNHTFVQLDYDIMWLSNWMLGPLLKAPVELIDIKLPHRVDCSWLQLLLLRLLLSHFPVCETNSEMHWQLPCSQLISDPPSFSCSVPHIFQGWLQVPHPPREGAFLPAASEHWQSSMQGYCQLKETGGGGGEGEYKGRWGGWAGWGGMWRRGWGRVR